MLGRDRIRAICKRTLGFSNSPYDAVITVEPVHSNQWQKQSRTIRDGKENKSIRCKFYQILKDRKSLMESGIIFSHSLKSFENDDTFPIQSETTRHCSTSHADVVTSVCRANSSTLFRICDEVKNLSFHFSCGMPWKVEREKVSRKSVRILSSPSLSPPLSPRPFSQICSEIQGKRLWAVLSSSLGLYLKGSNRMKRSIQAALVSKSRIRRRLASKRVSSSSVSVGHLWSNSSRCSSLEGLTSDGVCRL